MKVPLKKLREILREAFDAENATHGLGNFISVQSVSSVFIRV